MTDEDVVRRAALVLETGCHRHPPRMPHHKEVFTLRVRSRRAVEVMTALHRLMGSRRQGQIEAALSARSLNTCRIPYDTEVSEMVAAKAAGASRHELAAKYGVTAKAVDKLVRGAERSLDDIFECTERIAAIEELLTGGARGLQLGLAGRSCRGGGVVRSRWHFPDPHGGSRCRQQGG